MVGAAHGAPAGTVLEVFRRLDLNEDGRIDREEFLKIPTGVEPGISSWFESVFDEADVDGDGSLQKEEAELMMHLIQTTIGRLERADAPFQHRGSTMVSQMFPMIDTNRDGRIGRHELVHAFVSTVARHGQGQARLDDATIRELEEHFVSADIDADGGLDMDEAVIMLDMFLSALGTDSAREEDRGEWINFERIFRDLHLGDYDDDDDEALDLDESPDGRSESESYGKVGHGVGSGIVDRGEVLGVADEKMVEDFDSDDSGILDLDEDDDLLIFGDDDDVCILDFDNDDLGILDFDSEPQDLVLPAAASMEDKGDGDPSPEETRATLQPKLEAQTAIHDREHVAEGTPGLEDAEDVDNAQIAGIDVNKLQDMSLQERGDTSVQERSARSQREDDGSKAEAGVDAQIDGRRSGQGDADVLDLDAADAHSGGVDDGNLPEKSLQERGDTSLEEPRRKPLRKRRASRREAITDAQTEGQRSGQGDAEVLDLDADGQVDGARGDDVDANHLQDMSLQERGDTSVEGPQEEVHTDTQIESHQREGDVEVLDLDAAGEVDDAHSGGTDVGHSQDMSLQERGDTSVQGRSARSQQEDDGSKPEVHVDPQTESRRSGQDDSEVLDFDAAGESGDTGSHFQDVSLQERGDTSVEERKDKSQRQVGASEEKARSDTQTESYHREDAKVLDLDAAGEDADTHSGGTDASQLKDMSLQARGDTSLDGHSTKSQRKVDGSQAEAGIGRRSGQDDVEVWDLDADSEVDDAHSGDIDASHLQDMSLQARGDTSLDEKRGRSGRKLKRSDENIGDGTQTGTDQIEEEFDFDTDDAQFEHSRSADDSARRRGLLQA